MKTEKILEKRRTDYLGIGASFGWVGVCFLHGQRIGKQNGDSHAARKRPKRKFSETVTSGHPDPS